MQQPKMIVLGLVSIGLRYGFEMEKFAEETQMRLWAQIGMSTIYKALKDLKKEGAIRGKAEPSGKGPGRIAYSITAKGRKLFRKLVADALASRASVYSERIAGLVFTPALPKASGAAAIRSCIEGLGGADEALKEQLREKRGDVMAEAVIDYYRDVYAAERKAMAKVLAAIEK